jgi:hypothetical protein
LNVCGVVFAAATNSAALLTRPNVSRRKKIWSTVSLP